MEFQIVNEYTEAVQQIKSVILQSRYQAARAVNKEALALYYYVGKYISEHSRGQWGMGAISAISRQLQQELPRLRGFSDGNMRKMRAFYEEWAFVFEICSSITNEIDSKCAIDFGLGCQVAEKENIIIRSLTTNKISESQLQAFLATSFSHHYELLSHTDSLPARLFYIERIAKEFWSVEKLKHNLAQHLYEAQEMPNNFVRTIPEAQLQQLAAKAFREEYLLDFIAVDDPDLYDERKVEDAIVHNIRKFIMALGSDFSFMGNQYRLIVDEKEYFIDLLFYNRRLQSLVAIELKYTDFKPEYVGKLNFYLSALDDMVRLPNENPSIGIILCRGKSEKTVEYALRDTTKPMGVATYKTANELPTEYKSALSDLDNLAKLI